MRAAHIALLAPFLLIQAAAAQRAILRNAPGCAGQTQADMNACAAESFRDADAGLNAAYRRITARLAGNPAGRSLVEAQRAWIRFRDAECDLATSTSEGGSIRPMLMSSCMERLTQQRTAELDGDRRCGARDDCVAPAR